MDWEIDGTVIGEVIDLSYDMAISYHPEKSLVLVRTSFPKGWSPRVGCLRFELPEDYPRTKPTVSLPNKYEYDGAPWIESRLRPPLAPVNEDWTEVNLRHFEWNPSKDDLCSFTSFVLNMLSEPRDVPYVRDKDTPSPLGWGPGIRSERR